MANKQTKVATKTKPVIHLTKKDKLVLTNQTSGKQSIFDVHSVEINEGDYGNLPTDLSVRLAIATPEPYNSKASSVIGYRQRDNVEVVA